MSKLSVEPQKTAAFGAIGVGYSAIGTPFSNACSILTVQNLTNAVLQFSFNGVDDHFPLAIDAKQTWDACANRTNAQEGAFFSKGTQMYVKRIGTPTSGAVYVTVIYDAA